jgi:hypothetical protein
MKKGQKIVILRDCFRLDYQGNTKVIAWKGDEGEYIGHANGTMHYCMIGKQVVTLRESEYSVVDPIVEDVVAKFRRRSQEGIKKYGTTLEDNQKSIIAWAGELQEELMDAVLYVQKLMKERRQELLIKIMQEDEKDGLYDEENRGEEGFPKVSENVD